MVVGVITPYRSQRDLIRDTFRRILGPVPPPAARLPAGGGVGAGSSPEPDEAEIRIETVDSFQV
jgi:superfamily I DNA and/or RNA helicase